MAADFQQCHSGRTGKNRRVELIVTGLDLDALAGDDIKQYYSMRESTGTPSPAYQPEEQNAAS